MKEKKLEGYDALTIECEELAEELNKAQAARDQVVEDLKAAVDNALLASMLIATGLPMHAKQGGRVKRRDGKRRE